MGSRLMNQIDHTAIHRRIEEIETLDDYTGWIRDLSEFAGKDVTIENPSTADYLESLSVLIADTKHMTPTEVSDPSISFKSMAKALYSALYYE